MIRLIASDMDGTLLNAKLEISEENIKAIKMAQSKGIIFMAATGRSLSEATPPLDAAEINCGLITSNGAQIFSEDRQVEFTVSISKNKTKEIMTIFENNDIYYEIATNNGVYSTNPARRIEHAATLLANTIPHLTFKMAIGMATAYLDNFQVHYIDDYNSLLTKKDIKILKLIAFSDQEQKELRPVADRIHKLGDLTVTSSHPTNIEINHHNAQKGIAVKHVAEKLNIPLSQVMTIGDNFNDISMLQEAGVSFAMENAANEVKKSAKYITTSHVDSGVGKAIMRAINESL